VKIRIPFVMAVGTATAVAAAMTAGPAGAQPARPLAKPVTPALAAEKAASLVAARPAYLHASPDDTFARSQVLSSHGLQYVAYERTYKDVPVRGGDFVVVVDAAGQTKYTSVAQSRPIGELSVIPKLPAATAAGVARKQLTKVTSVEGTTLVVVAAEGKPARLAWETTVAGTGADGPSRLSVAVDATTGAVLSTQEHIIDVAGTGTGWINGTVPLDTTLSGSTYSLQDPAIANLSCQDSANNTTFTGPDNVWGTGVASDKETGCVDALYVAQQQKAMLSSWLGRNGQNGTGGAWPIRVGLNDQNAYYNGSQVQIGKNSAGQWITSADVVGHELGHGIDDKTPGGISRGNTSEFVADVFGAATESFANNPNDPPDYQVGEEINLVGSGPIRYMYNPSLAGNNPNCYSWTIPFQEVHAAAGPGNHWFYLLAEGTSPTNGQPASTTCNSTSITGIGIRKATTIFYNAMLMKTSSSSYPKYRLWTLQAAKNLYPGSCVEFNAVKAAWAGVSVPAQSGEPTCS